MKKYMLQLSKNEIIDICGIYPPDFEKIDIQSDADFTFVNDPNYSAVQLFDVESLVQHGFVEQSACPEQFLVRHIRSVVKALVQILMVEELVEIILLHK